MLSTGAPIRYRFGLFELNRKTGELRKRGARVKLPRQAMDVLTALLERPGEVVTREEFRKALWPGETFVDFDHSVNVAINRIRAALDETDDRKFVETLPRVGYRFLSPVDVLGTSVPGGDTSQTTPGQDVALSDAPAPSPEGHARLYWPVAVCVACAAVLLIVAGRLMVPAHPRAPIRSLAVLPLANLSNSPEQEYFADGMTDALIANLAKIGQLRVISQTSAMQYKGAHKKLPLIGRELNVTAIIEGAVMRAGDRVRITVQLVDAVTDEHLWAETYERDLHDVLWLQSEVAQAIASEIRMRLTAQDRARFARTHKVDPAAYDAFLRGQYFINRRRPQEFPKAQEYLQKAVTLQPGYALAWAALGECSLLILRDPRERTRQTTAYERRALELDPTLGEPHTALAMVHIYDNQWAAAEAEFRKAIELSPNYPLAHDSYAMFLAFMGRFDASLLEAGKALALDPLSPLVHLHVGLCYTAGRRYDQAAEHFRKVFEIDPGNPWTHNVLAEVYVEKKMYPEALAEYRASKSLPPLPDAGWRQVWEAELKRQQAKLADGKRVGPFWMAMVHAYLGKNREAIDWLEKAEDVRDTSMWSIGERRIFDGLRSDPRFSRLLQRLGLPTGQAGR